MSTSVLILQDVNFYPGEKLLLLEECVITGENNLNIYLLAMFSFLCPWNSFSVDGGGDRL